MINLILDTNVYRRDIKRNTAAFQALESLIQKKLIKLHLPHFIEREFISQLYLIYLKCYEDIIKNLIKLSEIKFLDTNTIRALEKNYFDKQKILEQSQSYFLSWLSGINAERHDVGLDSYQATFDDYFKGNPPFNGIKSRKDIPDSLVFQSIKNICEKESNVHFISEDEQFLKACGKSFSDLKTYVSLDTFIQSDTCRPLLSTSDESVILDYSRSNVSTLTHVFSQIVPSFLSGKTIESYKIPDDNHEGYIVSAGEPDSVEYQFNHANYYGQGVLVVPCTFNTNVEIYYYLYKPDYYAMQETLSISDHSEHYYQVSQNFEVSVKAAVRFEFEVTKDDGKSIVELKNSGIDVITDLEVL